MDPREVIPGEVRRLTEDEIRKLYPTASINLAPMSKQEQFDRHVRNLKARKFDYYRSIVGFRE